MSVTSTATTTVPYITIEEIKVIRNRVVGDFVGLFMFSNVAVDIKTSEFNKNGVITAETFTAPTTQRTLTRLVDQTLTQAKGIFTMLNCEHVLSQGNKFNYNAADSGTIYTLKDTPFTAKANTYDYQIATIGSIALISGSDYFKSVHQNEVIKFCLGTAYVVSSDDELHLNMHVFQNLRIEDCADEMVPVFYLDKVGGWILRSSYIIQSYSDSTSILRDFRSSDNTVFGSIWTQSYLDTRLVEQLNTMAGTILALECYYLGYDGTDASIDVIIDGVTYPVIPDSVNNKHLWMVNNEIFNQIGQISGVVTVSDSYLYISTTDGTYESPT